MHEGRAISEQASGQWGGGAKGRSETYRSNLADVSHATISARSALRLGFRGLDTCGERRLSGEPKTL